MEIKVYVDVLFGINFGFDYLLLWLTAGLLRVKITYPRLLFSATIGALYATLVFFSPLTLPGCLPVKLTVGGLMVFLAFRPASFRAFMQESVIFFTLTLLYGGCAFAFFYFSDFAASLGAVYKNGTLYINIPPLLLLSLALFCSLIFKIALSWGARVTSRGKSITELKIVYQNKAVFLRGFYDSGNLLREVVSGKGVIVAQWESVKAFFPHRKNPEEAEKDGLIPIPYRTLQGDSLLFAFLPDAIYIKHKKTLIPTERVYVGLTDKTLDYHHQWDAILPHDFEGENHHETTPYSETAEKNHSQKSENCRMASL